MSLKSIKKITLGFICFAFIAFSSLTVLADSAIALPEAGPMAAMEEMAEDANAKMEETAENTQKAVEEGMENAGEKAQEAKEAVEDKVKEDPEKTEATDEDNGGIIDKVKSFFSGE
ncbi:MAG: hypothetical protein ACLFQP_10185 [Halothece sp.]